MAKDKFIKGLLEEKNKGIEKKKFSISMSRNDYEDFARNAVDNYNCTSIQERVLQLIKNDVEAFRKASRRNNGVSAHA